MHCSKCGCGGGAERETHAFTTPDLWPPNSTDLNSVNYKIWGIIQQRVYHTKVQDVSELKQHLIDI